MSPRPYDPFPSTPAGDFVDSSEAIRLLETPSWSAMARIECPEALRRATRALCDSNIRNRVFAPALRRALGPGHRRLTPHSLRHTFASLHLSRGTNLLRVQQQGGWTSPQVLLDTYTHFMPSEVRGFADALTALYGTKLWRRLSVRWLPQTKTEAATTSYRGTPGRI